MKSTTEQILKAAKGLTGEEYVLATEAAAAEARRDWLEDTRTERIQNAFKREVAKENNAAKKAARLLDKAGLATLAAEESAKAIDAEAAFWDIVAKWHAEHAAAAASTPTPAAEGAAA